MTWTAEIKSTTKSDLGLQITVQFTDGVKTTSVPFNVSEPDSIKTLIQRQIDQYEKIASVDAVALVGPVDLTKPAPVGPTQAQLDAQAYGLNVARFRQMQGAIKAGVLDAGDASVIALQATLKKDFLPEYLSFFNGL